MAKMETLTDAFTTQDAAKWSGFTANVSVTGGQLNIIPDNTFTRILESVTTYDLASSYAMVEVPQVGSSIVASMSLIAVDGDRLEIYYESPNMRFRETLDGTPSDTFVTYSAGSHRWWRIRESGGTALWDTSSDGATWVNQRSKTWAISAVTAMQVRFMAYTSAGVTPALFDNFNLGSVPVAGILRFNGTAFVAAAGTRRWNGSAWVAAADPAFP